jgi:hypothetical protein
MDRANLKGRTLGDVGITRFFTWGHPVFWQYLEKTRQRLRLKQEREQFRGIGTRHENCTNNERLILAAAKKVKRRHGTNATPRRSKP